MATRITVTAILDGTLTERLPIVNRARNLAIMAKREMEPGAVARRAADNLAEIRDGRRMSQAELADHMNQLGRPVTASVISKTEQLDRRLDVDDLVAFAVALGVTPNRLLLPGSISESEPVELTPEVCVSAMDAWKWATGDEPLPSDCGPAVLQILIRDDYERLFNRINRPHNVPEPVFHNVGHDVRDHPELVRMIATVVTKAKECGLDLGRLVRLVDEVDRWRLFGQLDQAMAKLYEGDA
jgi:transcriptional regulator with XRE-family HTH domain